MTPLARIFRSPDDGRLRAGWRLLAHGALVLTFSVLFSLAILVPLLAFSALAGWSEQLFGFRLPPELGELLSADSLSSRLLALSAIVSFPSMTLATWLARRWFDRRSFQSLGFDPSGQPGRDLTFGFALPAMLFGLIFVAEWALGWVRVDGWLWQTSGPGWTVALVMGSLMVFALVGFYEELVFRGYYLVNLTDGMGQRWALLFSSVAFALAHAGNPFASWISTLGLIGAGLFLAYAALRTQRLWLPIGLHLGWNFFEGTIFGFPVSGSAAPSLLRQTIHGPAMLTGGGFGPEAGLIVLPALLLGAGLIHIYTGTRAPVESPGRQAA